MYYLTALDKKFIIELKIKEPNISTQTIRVKLHDHCNIKSSREIPSRQTIESVLKKWNETGLTNDL